jgi:ABC-type branched-subunit amino acid transport system permease subunit
VALALAAFLQWDQVRGGESRLRNLGDTYAIALIAQLLTVVGTVALTGAVFGYVLLAVRRDREQASIEGQAPDASWSE